MKKILLVTLLSLMGFMFLTNSVEAYQMRYDDNGNGSAVHDNGNGEIHSGGGGSFGDTTPNTGETASDGTSGTTASCADIGDELTSWLSNALKFVQYAGVGLAVVLTAVDFIQVIGGSKEDDLKKAFDRTVKRLIAVVLLLLTGVLVNFIITTFINPVLGENQVENCIK